MSKREYVFAAVMLGLCGGFVRAQNPPSPPAPAAKPANYAYRYRVLGVYDEQTGDPLEGVEVADVLNGNKSLTTKTGTVSLFFLPDGGGLVRVRKLGYEVQTLTVSISPADTTPITVVLSHATQLAAVVVKDSAPKYISPALRGFDERRRGGQGHFITDTMLRKNDNHSLGDVITSNVPGVMMAPGRGGAKYLVSSRRMCSGPALRACRQSDCYVSVYVDNAKIFDASMGTNGLPDFGRMSPVEYAAAEFYQGAEVPPEYNSSGAAACGVLLLWTRER
ncbi:MAG TPA: hypothetical protein VN706_22635 [Gemmatimonadaceae bacterium]|nr:hypothetical protein [Gemmatimonadaceae bacterium]